MKESYSSHKAVLRIYQLRKGNQKQRILILCMSVCVCVCLICRNTNSKHRPVLTDVKLMSNYVSFGNSEPELFIVSGSLGFSSIFSYPSVCFFFLHFKLKKIKSYLSSILSFIAFKSCHIDYLLCPRNPEKWKHWY